MHARQFARAGHERVHQIGAVHVQVWKAVRRDGGRAEHGGRNDVAVLPVAHLGAFRHERDVAQALLQPEFEQHANTIRAELDAGADLAEMRRLFEHVHVEPAAPERERGRQPANAAADDQNGSIRCSYGHLATMADHAPSVSGRLRNLDPVAANTAFATAGAIGGVPGSPMPVGLFVLGTTCTSTTGISFIRNNG